MIRWTKDGKVDREYLFSKPVIEEIVKDRNSLADTLDIAVAALRESKRIGGNDELLWEDSGNQMYQIVDDALRQIGAEHD